MSNHNHIHTHTRVTIHLSEGHDYNIRPGAVVAGYPDHVIIGVQAGHTETMTMYVATEALPGLEKAVREAQAVMASQTDPNTP